MRRLIVSAILVLSGALQAAAADLPGIPATEYAALRLVMPANAERDRALAAREFQHYWKACTGHDIPIETAPADRGNVWIGVDAIPAPLAADVDLTGLGKEGLVIRTLASGDLVIAGATPRGTLNGVYEFFERFMGVRWLTHDVTHIPSAAPASLPPLDYRFVPPFRFRWTNSFHGDGEARERFSRAHHMHQPTTGGPGGHNFFVLVPPPTYFPEHPEYFGMNEDGVRVTLDDEASYTAEWSKRDWDRVYQLCMSNPDIPAVIMERLRAWREKEPGADYYCVMQEDTDHHCLCPECKAIDEREGTPMGSMLTGINRVADLFQAEFPDSTLLTFAYAYTRHPPETLKPRDNVHIQLCTIECDFLRPIGPAAGDENEKFFEDLQGWSKLTNNLLMYDYSPNFAAWMRPHPNFHVIVPNLRTYSENGAMGAFVQGDPYGVGGMEPLRTYLIVQGLWNPNIDWQATQHEFLNLYYGQAARFMEDYVALMTQTALEKKVIMGCFDDARWVDAKFVQQGIDLMNRAMAAAENDEIRRRVRAEWLRLQYAGLTCTAVVNRDADRYVLTRPAEVDSAQFLDWCREFEIKQLDEQYGRSGVPIDESVEEHMGDLGLRRPREEYGIVTLENSRYLVEVAPDFAGAVVRFEDKKHRRDAFRAGEGIAANLWTMQEWNMRVPGKINREAALSSAYRVIEQSSNLLVLETALDSGLVVRRSMSLPEGGAPLSVTWEMRNTSGADAVPYVKIHPEFWAGGQYEPEIWVERDGNWTEQPLDRASAGFFGGGPVAPTGVSRIAARIPKKRQTITVSVNPEELETLFYFFSSRREHVNIELIPKQTPLAPGETRTVHAQYELSRRVPR